MEIHCRRWPLISRAGRASPDELARAWFSHGGGAPRGAAFSPLIAHAAAEARRVSLARFSRPGCAARFEPSPPAPLAHVAASLPVDFAHRARIRPAVLAVRAQR